MDGRDGCGDEAGYVLVDVGVQGETGTSAVVEFPEVKLAQCEIGEHEGQR